MADYEYVQLTGVIVPDTGEIQTQVQNEFKEAFGQDLIVTANTPQGILITAETLARTAVVDNNAQLANQINPNIAGGIFLTAIGALTGSSKTSATNTTVSCTVTGVTGTIIPRGSQARDSNGNIFESLTQVTLPAGSPGTAEVDFAAVESGPITVAANSLTQIVSTILGWETVTNSDIEFVLGSTEQTDASFRAFRRATLAEQGTNLAIAIISNLLELPGVLSLKYRENVLATTQVIDGVTMIGHSIYVCIDGGDNTAIANTFLYKKSGGCGYNNGGSSHPQSVTVTAPLSGQIMDVLFDRPNLVPVLVRVTISTETSIQNPTDVVKQAILDYVNGLINGDVGLGVGVPVSSFELAGAINIQAPNIFVIKVETSLASVVSYSCDEIPIAIYEKATIDESSISVILA